LPTVGFGFDKFIEGVAIDNLVLECKLRMKIEDFFNTTIFINNFLIRKMMLNLKR
jgi:hypothetical protein